MAAKPTQYWAVMPAAGVGQRFGAELPKQYLRLHNKTVLEHAVEAVWQAPMLKAMVVCVSSDDQWIEPLIESNSALNAQQSEHRTSPSMQTPQRPVQPSAGNPGQRPVSPDFQSAPRRVVTASTSQQVAHPAPLPGAARPMAQS